MMLTAVEAGVDHVVGHRAVVEVARDHVWAADARGARGVVLDQVVAGDRVHGGGQIGRVESHLAAPEASCEGDYPEKQDFAHTSSVGPGGVGPCGSAAYVE